MEFHGRASACEVPVNKASLYTIASSVLSKAASGAQSTQEVRNRYLLSDCNPLDILRADRSLISHHMLVGTRQRFASMMLRTSRNLGCYKIDRWMNR